MSIEREKQVAAEAAADLVENHMTVGLGTGTTVAFLLPALARARQILWLVTGEDKKEPLEKLLAGDTTIPAGRIEAAASLVMADHAAT